ncbi:MAG: 5-formyltetrahydrofolate cyclo-ligase [Lachnospiraceae bacterium]|nr:5-formyltetrahydrofolate cyclo-ligase [Lachnospiraceae bacterium]
MLNDFAADINEEKKLIRKRLIKERLDIIPADRKRYDEAILLNLTKLSGYMTSDILLTYASYNGEADTFCLIEDAVKNGKRVACPRCTVKNGEPVLEFRYIGSAKELISGYKGIPEPGEDNTKTVEDRDIKKAAVIIPMVGYDPSGNRIGYGKGFYDRFLSRNRTGINIGIAYSCQECISLPACRHDIKPDIIVTEKAILKISP